MADLTCPPFGTGSVDFCALHDAAKKLEKSSAATDADLAEAAVKATTTVEPPPAPPADAKPAAPMATDEAV